MHLFSPFLCAGLFFFFFSHSITQQPLDCIYNFLSIFFFSSFTLKNVTVTKNIMIKGVDSAYLSSMIVNLSLIVNYHTPLHSD